MYVSRATSVRLNNSKFQALTHASWTSARLWRWLLLTYHCSSYVGYDFLLEHIRILPTQRYHSSSFIFPPKIFLYRILNFTTDCCSTTAAITGGALGSSLISSSITNCPCLKSSSSCFSTSLFSLLFFIKILRLSKLGGGSGTPGSNLNKTQRISFHLNRIDASQFLTPWAVLVPFGVILFVRDRKNCFA